MFKKISCKVLLILLLIACTDEHEDNLHPGPGTQLLDNPTISLYPDSVKPWFGGPIKKEGFEIGVSEEFSLIGKKSLFVEKTDSLLADFGYWSQRYRGPMPAQGSRLELIAFLKGENLRRSYSGHNITISIQVSNWADSSKNVFIASGLNVPLEGDFDWRPVVITLDRFPAEADEIQVSLLMPYTMTGKIYFDEINLTVR